MTTRIGTVLCGVDGSEESLHAARAAQALAGGLEGHVVLAHVNSGGGRSSVPRAAAHSEVDGAFEVLADAAARAGLPGVRTRRVEARSVTDGLVGAARVESPALIVVGASGSSGIRAALVGSVAGKLPLKAPCPVMVVPADAELPDPLAPRAAARTIVCGITESSEGPAVAAAAGRLARALGARLILVHARLPIPPVGAVPLSRHSVVVADEAVADREQRLTTDFLERAVGWSECAPGSVETEIEVGEPAERIEVLADQASADLIVVGSRGRGRISAAVLGSTSRTLAGSAGRPVVIVGPAAHG